VWYSNDNFNFVRGIDMENNEISLEEKRLDLEEYLNEFLLFYHGQNALLFDNIPLIYDLTYDAYDFWGDFFEANDFDIDFEKVTKADFFENKLLIEQFFEEIGLEFNFEEIIQNGVLDVKYNERNNFGTIDEEMFPDLFGSVGIEDDKVYVLFSNNGLITDSVIWVHEIAHYRNETGLAETEGRSLLTEGVSFAMQFIYTDFLYNHGYEHDAKVIMLDDIDTLYNNVRDCIPLLRLVMTYIEQGRIDEESYNNRFSDMYERVLNSCYEQFQRGEHYFFNSIRYAIAFSVGIYMYMSYKKDNSFLCNIEKLNNALKKDNDIRYLLRIIGIKNIDMDIFDLFKQNFYEMAGELIDRYQEAKILKLTKEK